MLTFLPAQAVLYILEILRELAYDKGMRIYL